MSKIKINTKEINEDFSEEIKKGQKIIILVEHSKSTAKLEVFKRYIERRFYKNLSSYVIAVARKEQIPTNRMKPNFVMNLLENDMKSEYDEFSKRYPEANIENIYAFHYCIDMCEDGSGEIMSVALMRIRDEYYKVEFSPIVPITKFEYEALVNSADDEKSIFLHNIVTEELMGDELYGLIGYLTHGKFTTLDMYMQNLCDIIPILRDIQKRRSKVVKYKKHKVNDNIYINSLSSVNNTVSDEELENTLI